MKKLSIEMFIKRKTKVGKGDAYRMLERFKTLVTYEKKSTSIWTTVFATKLDSLPDIVQCLVPILRPACRTNKH